MHAYRNAFRYELRASARIRIDKTVVFFRIQLPKDYIT